MRPPPNSDVTNAAPTRRVLSDDVRWGLKWGMSAAFFFSAWVGLVRAASGTEPFDEIGLALESVIAAYVAFGVVGGVILGLLRPLMKSQLGSALVGWIIAIIVYCGLALMTGTPPWQNGFILSVVLFIALIVGGTGGIVHWRRHAKRK